LAWNLRLEPTSPAIRRRRIQEVETNVQRN
jgi:hypothetical protein